MFYCYVSRTDLEEEKTINHHGTERVVKSKEENENVINDVNKLFTFVSKIPNQEIKGFNKDLVSNDEKIQDNALKEYYRNVTITSNDKKMILNVCIMISQQIKPVVALIFVIWYWSSGL